MQIIDVRDLGAFLLRCATTGTAGAFDGVGPFAPTGELLAEITPDGVVARLVEVDAATLAAGRHHAADDDRRPCDAVVSIRPGAGARVGPG